MKMKIAIVVLIIFTVMISTNAIALAGIIHSNISSQDLSLADLSGRSYYYAKPGGENFWIIGAMVAMAIVYMLIDKTRAKKTNKN